MAGTQGDCAFLDRYLSLGNGGLVNVEAQMMVAAQEKVAVLGYGVTGQAAARYLVGQDKVPVIVDSRPQPAVELPPNAECFFEQAHWPEVSVNKAILSPGLAMDSCLVQGAARAGVTLVSDIDVFFQAVACPVVGVTGTNGKSTVTSWVAHCLNEAGILTIAGGNLGEAALDLLQRPAEVYVLELSSFQLERSQEHPFKVATILNISEDHLDQHQSMDNYIAAKRKISRRAEVVVVNATDPKATSETEARKIRFDLAPPTIENPWGVVGEGAGRSIVFGNETVIAIDDLALPGEHNVANALATAAIAHNFTDLPSIARGLREFHGLAHRYVLVAEQGGVSFINDSKATNPGATVAALSGLPMNDNVILIVGGDAKGADLSSLEKVLDRRVKMLLTLGRDGPAFQALADRVKLPWLKVESLAEAVAVGTEKASPGDVVLLSPACASLDMFSSYAERGELFESLVKQALGLEGA
ncbi:MAG: UDP-N-acetylmuramoylalanine--D-glutamate ligase [Limisphaerales bacterium]